MKKLRIGIVGAGNIATNAHLPAYPKCDNVTVAAIADFNLDRAKAAAERFNIPAYYGSVEEMLEKADIDAVDICTWNNGHAPVCIAAAKAGKHVLCEKPLTTDMTLAHEMEKAIKDAGVTFHLAVPGRFGNANIYLRRFYEKGGFGDVYYAKTANVRRRGTPTGWFTDKKHAGGGPVIDIGVHAIDAAWYLMGNPKPTRISAGVFHKIGDYKTKGISRWQGTPCDDNHFDVEDSGMGVIHFENGASLLFEATWALNAPGSSGTMICGTKAGATLDPMVIYGERDGYLSDDKITDQSPEDRFAREITHFADCALKGKETIYPIDQAVQMQQMLCGIYEAAEKNKEIVL